MKKLRLSLIFVVLVYSVLLIASEELKQEFIELEGWQADEIVDASVMMTGFNFVSLSRTYNKADMEIVVTYMAGNNAMLQGYKTDMSVETSEASFETTEIDGFRIIKSFNKVDKSGAYVLDLVSTETAGALLMMSFSGIDAEEAMNLLKKFNWKAYKTEGEKEL